MDVTFFVVLTFLLINCPTITNIQNPPQTINYIDNEQKNHDNFLIPIENIHLLTENKIIGYVYFGRNSCPFCQVFNTLLWEEVQSNPALVIYKFDTDTWRQDEKFQDVLAQYYVENIPQLIKINTDGSILIFEVSEDYSDAEVISALHIFLNT